MWDCLVQAHSAAAMLGIRLQREESDGRRIYHSISTATGSFRRIESQDSERARSLAQALDDVTDSTDALHQYLLARHIPWPPM